MFNLCLLLFSVLTLAQGNVLLPTANLSSDQELIIRLRMDANTTVQSISVDQMPKPSIQNTSLPSTPVIRTLNSSATIWCAQNLHYPLSVCYLSNGTAGDVAFFEDAQELKQGNCYFERGPGEWTCGFDSEDGGPDHVQTVVVKQYARAVVDEAITRTPDGGTAMECHHIDRRPLSLCMWVSPSGRIHRLTQDTFMSGKFAFYRAAGSMATGDCAVQWPADSDLERGQWQCIIRDESGQRLSVNLDHEEEEIVEEDVWSRDGTVARPGQFPHQVSIQKEKKHICAGAILNDRWILTSALCSQSSSDPSDYRIGVGAVDWQKGRRYKVEKIVIHDLFDAATGAYALALWKTSEKITFNDKVKRITINWLYEGGKETLSGWGSMCNSPGNRFLRHQEMGLLGYDACENFYKAMLVETPSYCLNRSMGVFEADLGSPSIYKGRLEGMVYGPTNCTDVSKPDLVINVRFNADWIWNSIYKNN